MQVDGVSYRTIWPDTDNRVVRIIDQTKLPHVFETLCLTTVEEAATAIRDMQVRGAPLIGVTAAYGIALAMRDNASDAALAKAYEALRITRPTAVNLQWGLERMVNLLQPLPSEARATAAWHEAAAIADEDATNCAAMGKHGSDIIQNLYQRHQRTINILTHCNAGWLATVDWGTALAPVYTAYNAGIPLHIWVDETRPRNQGASLTAWELAHHGIPHTVIVDNVGGHLMQHGMVDLAIVGCDRATARGDVCNKIGTYLKALAAHDNDIPFYVAVPSSSIDWTLQDGKTEIPIEQRASEEVTHISGLDKNGQLLTVCLTPPGSKAANYGFDVTPARLITGWITEHGVHSNLIEANIHP